MEALARMIVLELFPKLATLCARTMSTCSSCVSTLLLAHGRSGYDAEYLKSSQRLFPVTLVRARPSQRSIKECERNRTITRRFELPEQLQASMSEGDPDVLKSRPATKI